MDDSYDPASVESRWRERWQDEAVYRYDDDEQRPDYVIDTPPPYPTGNLHIGNALGWCYMDFAARFHRLQGKDVLFPQGWDCHGLPTEVKVEENHDIHRTDVSRERFRELCVEHTERQIDAMKDTMGALGFSQDWSQEYKTMDPEYWGKTQQSFVEMADDDYVYRDEHPVNWCPRCETAIADAEVEAEDDTGTLYTIRFDSADERSSSASQTRSDAAESEDTGIEIATTRPELLPACVAIAVSPDDDRYTERVGETFEVPVFGQDIEVIADEEVDSTFGTGAVMICTFGDKQDVDWWAEYDLPLRPAITEDGHLNERGAEFEGLSIEEAKARIPSVLQKSGYLQGEEPIDQSVGTCWRCGTPIEILSKEQWFVRVDSDEILDTAREVEWIPEHMYSRLKEWTESMAWDWVISRQREFATPIPAWFCESCGHVHIAEVGELPVDPTTDAPAVGTCPECGGDDWTGETDVMDTWMDSSISPLHVAGWPETDFTPVQLREQGHDIIRTWAFYTILRTAALEDEKPWDEALINGMVFGEDGHKMSKSKGNFVQPEEVVEEHGADAFRQAIALGGQPGSDIQFQSKEVTSASRFLTKLWNISRFADSHLDGSTPEIDAPAYRDADRWILTELDSVAREVEADMDAYRFDSALREIREFVWHDLADDYLELVKGRLYEGQPEERDAARHALYTALSASLQMLAPFSPFVTEEIWRGLPGTEGSVHAADWPAIETGWDREEATATGALIAGAASTIRGWKSEAGMALNADLDRVEIYGEFDDGSAIDTDDLSETVNAPVYVEEGEANVELVPVGIDPDRSVIGPEFRDRAGAVLGALEETDPAEIEARKERDGEIELQVDEEIVVLDGDAVGIEREHRAESGEEVAVLETDGATVLVFP